MSIIKNLHRIVSDVEELQDKLSKAEAALTMAEIERDDARKEIAIGEQEAARYIGDRAKGLVVADLVRECVQEATTNLVDERDEARAERDRLVVLLGGIKHYFENQSAYGTQRLFDIRDRIDAALAEVVDDAKVERLCCSVHGDSWALNLWPDDAQRTRNSMRTALVAALEGRG